MKAPDVYKAVLADRDWLSQGSAAARWAPDQAAQVRQCLLTRLPLPAFVGRLQAQLHGKPITLLDLRGIDLGGVDLESVDLSYCALDGANLSGTNLSRSRLQYAQLHATNLEAAVFDKMQCSPIEAKGRQAGCREGEQFILHALESGGCRLQRCESGPEPFCWR